MKAACITAALAFAATVTLGVLEVAATPEKADKNADKAAAKTDKSQTTTADKKAGAATPTTLKGEMVCAKCALKEATKCQNVLKVAEGGTETKYYLVHDDVAKKNHGKVCSGSAKATVKGTVAEEGGKKLLTASEIKYE